MVTIKDIAAKTGFSLSTVSIVLKGNGNARKISAKTQEKVLQAAREMGYTPNTQAKILRGGSPPKATVTLFWASDIRVHMLSRFFNGLQAELLRMNYPCELQIKPYENNHLQDAMSDRTLLGCNGMIICNPSEKDMLYLENTDFPVPAVLYNRYSQKYITVNMDDEKIGRLPAAVFLAHHRTSPALLKSSATFNGMDIRTTAFERQMADGGTAPLISVTVTDSMKGGYEGALQLCRLDPLPDCLFCTSDIIAYGALKAFHQNGVRIPEQVELISVGNGNPDYQEYAIPSLSVVNLPMEAMAANCLRKICDVLASYTYIPSSTELPVQYIARESCPQ